MIFKLIQEIKKYIINNYKIIVTFFLFLFICTIKLPFYINKTGGIIDISDRIEINEKIDYTGSLNMAYVSSLEATIPSIILAYFNPKWDILTMEEEIGNESEENAKFRNKIALNESISNAIYIAFKKANKDVLIKKNNLYITYIYDEAKTNLKVGDKIIEIENTKVETKEDASKILQSYNAKDIINIKVINSDNNIVERQATMLEIDGIKVIGIILNNEYELETYPKINIKFKQSESGPSGGLMMSLEIYSQLINKDLTNGKKIVGTGTIDMYGNVGKIDGVKYKLAAAEKKKADIFFVPKENYNEAINEKNKNKYKINIIKVNNIDDAINYLSKIKTD